MATNAIPLATVEQAPQGLYADVAVAVAEFGQRRGGKRDLGELRQSLIDEPFKPPQGRSFVAGRVGKTAKASTYNPKGLPERTITEARVFEFGPVTYRHTRVQALVSAA